MVQHELCERRGVRSSRPEQSGPKNSYDTSHKIGLMNAKLIESMGPDWQSYTVPAAIAAIMPAGGEFPRELVRKANFGELDEAVAIVPKLLIRHRSILVQIDRRHARDPAAGIHDAIIS
nr:hypothetical protein B0A51_10918 [Rachicladosporium sp. CCFEE 5018]